MRKLLAIALGLGACSAPKSAAPVATHEASPASSAPCANCHGEIAAEWKASFHGASFTDATFQTSLGLEEPKDRAFCIDCHAPRGVPVGVDCVACHGPGFEQPHRRVAGARETCAGCHEFEFAGRSELVQKTVSEHAASSFASVTCGACHLPLRNGHRDHRFLSGHDPAAVRSVVHVDVKRASATAVAVAIRADVGHAFPTGDMFRRARLEVFAEGTHGEIVGAAERVFERSWSHEGARTQVGDTRIRGTWSGVVGLDPTAPIARVRWKLSYERVLAVRGSHVAVASSDPVGEGELMW